MTTERFSNQASTTLASSVSSGDLSITVQSTTHFPTQAEFRIRIGQELLLITGVAGATWTVSRGVESTTAASHAAGSAVVAVLTAGGLDEMRSEIEAEHLTAGSLASATTQIDVSAATAPTAGQALVATSSTSATWQDKAPTVANLTALTALVATKGQWAYVTTQRVYYVAVATGLGDVAGVTGISWKRVTETSDPAWLTQATWFISTTGSDEATGADVSHPLLTLNEIQNRLGRNPVLPQSITITFAYGSYPASQQTLVFTGATEGIIVTLVGTPNTAIISDTVATFVTASATTNRWHLLTGTTITDWTPYVGKRIRFTVSGAVCWVLKVNPFSLGNSTAEISQPWNEPIGPAYSAFTFTPTTSLAFVIEDIPLIPQLSLISKTSGVVEFAAPTYGFIPHLLIKSLSITDSTTNSSATTAAAILGWGITYQSWSVVESLPVTLNLRGCLAIVKAYYQPAASYQGCAFMQLAGSFQTQVFFVASCQFSFCVWEGIGAFFATPGINISDSGVFNSGLDGLQLAVTAQSISSSGLLLGSGNARGASIALGTSLNRLGGFANCKLTGTAGDFRFGSGTIMAWATDAPRAMNQGAVSGTLTSGTYAASITALPADAIVVPSYLVKKSGQTAVLGIASQTVNGFSIVNGDSGDSTSTVNAVWFSPSMSNGGAFSA